MMICAIANHITKSDTGHCLNAKLGRRACRARQSRKTVAENRNLIIGRRHIGELAALGCRTKRAIGGIR
jgi:hypothetical protein